MDKEINRLNKGEKFSGSSFKLYDTYGFPIDQPKTQSEILIEVDIETIYQWINKTTARNAWIWEKIIEQVWIDSQ